MKFCDKLAKQRKERNLSQEQLAEKLNVSRQAVSKWESGVSYPDMAKMLSICKVLDCTLDELMDDGSLGENTPKENTKLDLTEYFNDFLNYVTRIYNMFYSMTFKQKIKCVLEMGFIALILFFIGMIILYLVRTIIENILYTFFESVLIYNLINLILSIVAFALLIIATVVFFHLFKIRYLDYYITVVDSSVDQKIIEEPIDKKDNKKIIIRDPKHSSQKFFEMMYKIFIFLVKSLVLFSGLFIICLFLIGVFGVVVALYHGFLYNILFMFIAFGILGIAVALYVLIEMAYKFLFNLSINFLRLFYMGIAGLLVCGIGAGLGFSKFINLDYVSDNYKLITETQTIDNTESHIRLYLGNVSYVESDIDEIKIEFKYPDNYKLVENYIASKDLYIYDFMSIEDPKPMEAYNVFMNGLKENKVMMYTSNYNKIEAVIYAPEDVIERFLKNY